MKLTRPLVHLDIESATVGENPDPLVDKIITLALIKDFPDGSDLRYNFKFNPGIMMSEANIAIHGLTNAQVKEWPLLDKAAAKGIRETIQGCDLSGFNATGYDVPILWENLHAVGIDLDLTGISVIDTCTIFKRNERRDLASAIKFYCGVQDYEGHDAMADTAAHRDVLKAQLERYPDLAKMTIQELAKYSNNDRVNCDVHGVIYLNDQGVPCYSHRKVKGVPVSADPGYGRWLLRNNFSPHTQQVVQKILDEQFALEH